MVGAAREGSQFIYSKRRRTVSFRRPLGARNNDVPWDFGGELISYSSSAMQPKTPPANYLPKVIAVMSMASLDSTRNNFVRQCKPLLGQANTRSEIARFEKRSRKLKREYAQILAFVISINQSDAKILELRFGKK
jgi:hypothetical protein